MVGDGINDSAAMTQANVGISLATGAEIAIEAADMVLVRDGRVQEVVTALDLSRILFRRIQLNLVFSLIYNCLGIPVPQVSFIHRASQTSSHSGSRCDGPELAQCCIELVGSQTVQATKGRR
jgi:P-type E1-E2 ATPase